MIKVSVFLIAYILEKIFMDKTYLETMSLIKWVFMNYNINWCMFLLKLKYLQKHQEKCFLKLKKWQLSIILIKSKIIEWEKDTRCSHFLWCKCIAVAIILYISVDSVYVDWFQSGVLCEKLSAVSVYCLQVLLLPLSRIFHTIDKCCSWTIEYLWLINSSNLVFGEN